MQVGKNLKFNKSAKCYKAVEVGNFIAINYVFCLKISKINKSAGWSKGLVVGKFKTFNILGSIRFAGTS